MFTSNVVIFLCDVCRSPVRCKTFALNYIQALNETCHWEDEQQYPHTYTTTFCFLLSANKTSPTLHSVTWLQCHRRAFFVWNIITCNYLHTNVNNFHFFKTCVGYRLSSTILIQKRRSSMFYLVVHRRASNSFLDLPNYSDYPESWICFFWGGRRFRPLRPSCKTNFAPFYSVFSYFSPVYSWVYYFNLNLKNLILF